MDTTLDNDEIKIKSIIVSLECRQMLNEAFAYISENSLRQAEIMLSQFEEILDILKRMPGIGTKYENRMRKIRLGKFRYNIYYRELENEIEIVGIWHTSRGKDFED